MNGRELAARLGRARPETKVLFASGYAPESVREAANGEPEDGFAFLEKLYTRRALIHKIREVLDRPPARSVSDGL